MAWLSDLKTLYALTLAPVSGDGPVSRLESFYGRQAETYDTFRERLLHGRDRLMRAMPVAPGGLWIDVGGGTGRNIEALGPNLQRLGKVIIVDLCRSLLDISRQRVVRHNWTHVHLVQADATAAFARPGSADVITFSYALTMIPDWYSALERATEALKPGGHIGVVDFYVSRRHPDAGTRGHGWLTRHGWPAWFDRDGVRPNPDHVPYLRRHFEALWLSEHAGPVPYLPGVRMPWYLFVGRRRPDGGVST